MKKLFTLLAICFTVGAVCAQVTDDFESYDNYVVNPEGQWTFYDVDGASTYGFTGIQFDNSNSPMAFIVMNFDEIGYEMDITGHSGSKFLASFAATTPPNDDWIVSPQLDGTAGTINFWAQSYTDSYGLERMVVWASSTTNDISSFTKISDGSYVQVPAQEWTEYTYSYPAGTKYVAIQCVSNDAFIFLLDDITISSNSVGIETPENTTFSIYPNPATTTIKVTGEGNAVVTNILGQTVTSATVNGAAEINVSELESGVYFITMNGASKKFIKK